jgi:hypothetical protein
MTHGQRKVDQIGCALVRCYPGNEQVGGIKLDIGVQHQRRSVYSREKDRQRAEVFVKIFEPCRIVKAPKDSTGEQNSPHHGERHEPPRGESAYARDVPPDVRIVHE